MKATRLGWTIPLMLLACGRKREAPPPPAAAPGTTAEDAGAVADAADGPVLPADLAALLPPFPDALERDGFAIPLLIERFERGWGKPESSGSTRVWRNVRIGGCGVALVEATVDRADPSRVESVRVGLNDCGATAIAWLDRLGTPATPLDADRWRWTFAEGTVERPVEKTTPFRFVIAPWTTGSAAAVSSGSGREALLAGVERMREPAVVWRLTVDDPVEGAPGFLRALLGPDPRAYDALSYPFSADGLILESSDQAADLVSKFWGDPKARFLGALERSTRCAGATLRQMAEGTAIPYLERKPDVGRDLPALEAAFAPLGAKADDAVVSCVEPEGAGEGLLFLYRRENGRWWPAGVLD
jgi:hypothetical protein